MTPASQMSAGTTPQMMENKLSAEKLFDVMRDESWDLRCFDIPTGGGDADIGWRVIGHYEAEPHERVIAEIDRDDPAAAIRAALRARAQAASQ